MPKRGVDRFQIKIGGETVEVVSLPIARTDNVLAALSRSEQLVALDAVSGLSNAAIASNRKRSVRTIANQLASIYRKLGITSRAELALIVLGEP